MSDKLTLDRRVESGRPILATYDATESVGRELAWVLLSNKEGQPLASEEMHPTDDHTAFAIDAGVREQGAYRLQIRDLTPDPPGKAGAKNVVAKSALLEEQVVIVGDSDHLRVTLVPRARTRPDTRLASFNDFRVFLHEKYETELPDSFRAYTDDEYDQLTQWAREYVLTKTCESADELVPGYLEGRMEDARENGDLRLIRGQVAIPCVELIWNYWLEEGMLVQTLNSILARFQNRLIGDGNVPLARFDVTPLGTLHGILYSYVDDEQHRMTVRRRAAEYQYEYGLELIGRAVPRTSTFVERRSGFLEAFHQVLHQAHLYFKEKDDLTVNADSFPLYQALRDCHLVLSQGSHNQFGQLAVRARSEFIVMQVLLAQPEMRLFLGGRPMTPYPEPWMDRVDTMKTIQGWPEASILHYHELATVGERLVLTIRLGGWAEPGTGPTEAETWALNFREFIQKYVAAYRAVSGVDLSVAPDASMPSSLMLRRMREQRRRA